MSVNLRLDGVTGDSHWQDALPVAARRGACWAKLSVVLTSVLAQLDARVIGLLSDALDCRREVASDSDLEWHYGGGQDRADGIRAGYSMSLSGTAAAPAGSIPGAGRWGGRAARVVTSRATGLRAGRNLSVHGS